MAIGKLLREARIKSGLTQGEVAKKLKFQNSQFVYMIENGIASLPPARVNAYCKIVGANKDQVVEMMVHEYRMKLVTR